MDPFFQPIKVSLIVSITALLIVTVFGTGIAWLMEKKNFRGKLLLDILFMMPIALPPTVIGFLLIMCFGTNGILGQAIQQIFQQSLMFTVTAAIIAAGIVAFPLMYQSVRTGISQVKKDVEDAARVDGASERLVFSKVTLPLAKQSLFTGMILSFTRALGEFGATLMFAGNIPGKTQTVPMAIYVAFESGRMPLAWSWVVSIIVVSSLMIFFVRKTA
ncbi:molybdenum ABC transporter membrane protein [Gracilibacillus halophilus YIM-C55.5]|uniref:Molybdenum transport system permease n=1 Tax=Gracilibacillus halophilus YIM-C55.5 TaxID=1308866 RepID=N4WR93_9BACI|nr:molybdate ABC transporter permease subunit [Gracilibacillus halophilus]ENH95736.1 molybdenum ABC transporter membrane protein [Gracilibacillus halophilus YIM-C55.5]